MKLTQSLVSIEWLVEHFENPNLVILDASIPKVKASKQTPSNTTQIKNARFFDIKNKFSDPHNPLPNTMPSPEQFTREAQKLGINKKSIIVIYDQYGIYSSPRAWWMFKVMGHQNVAVLNGGLSAWQNGNHPCEEIVHRTYELGNFTAKFNSRLLTSQQALIENLDTKDKQVLDARSNSRFHATAPEPRASLKGGHIPHSKSLPHTNVVINGEMLTTNQLKEIFYTLDTKNKPLVFTCGSGITACIIALAATQVGLDNLSVYDGSWSEWGASDHLPIDQ